MKTTEKTQKLYYNYVGPTNYALFLLNRLYIVSGLSGLLAASGGLLSRDLLPTTTFPISYFGVSRKAVEAAAAAAAAVSEP